MILSDDMSSGIPCWSGGQTGSPALTNFIDMKTGSQLNKKFYDPTKLRWKSFQENGIVIHKGEEIWDDVGMEE